MTDVPSKEACEWAADVLMEKATLTMDYSRLSLHETQRRAMADLAKTKADVATYLRSLHEEATDD